ncbi:MAG TPA: phospholipase [Blastocatellia bacterium]|nr:phospholipase [Blastocatellia bacterium]
MGGDSQQLQAGKAAERGRLLARPRQVDQTSQTGLEPLGLGGKRDGLLYVPSVYRPDRPAPFVLVLHGAGGNARHALAPLKDLADEAGLIMLAPESRRQTWDVIVGKYGPDVAFIDRAMEQTFQRYNVNPARMAVEGFSDGASYALSLGVANGDLFTHVIAFSPGFLAPAAQNGMPRIFISHGVSDRVLPIDACSRKVVPRLKRAGYEVRYIEFDGPHAVPPEIAREALDWFGA